MRNTQLKLLANGEAETPITFWTNPATGQLYRTANGEINA